MNRFSVYAAAEEEASRFRWIESQKAGQDLGAVAMLRWVREHWHGYLRSRWVEHLKGIRFWIELDRGDFGLLQRQFADQALLLDRVLDRLEAGQQNLDILHWATTWGIPLPPLLEILEALDVNSRRLTHRFEASDHPRVTLEPTWLAWQERTIPRLARRMAEEDDYEGLPILGDALEEAGCTDPVVLEHCRSAGQQMRWSWVVGLILEQAWPWPAWPASQARVGLPG